MIPQSILVLPIMMPLAGAMLSAAVRSRISPWVALITCVGTLAADFWILGAAAAGGPQVYRVGGWSPPFGIVIVADTFGAILALVSAAIATMSSLHVAILGGQLSNRRLYHTIFLLLLTSLSGVFLTGDLFNLYVFMEMVILSSFALVAMADKPISAETTFKYAVLSAIGSLMLLLGVGLVYAATGTLNMADIGMRIQQAPTATFWNIIAAMMLFAFLLKGAIFPFHFWQPDAHSAAPAPVSAMLSGVLVKVGYYGLARMSSLIFPDTTAVQLLVPIGVVSILFGGIAALANNNIKRMLAYSTIANMGFIVLALGWGGRAGLVASIVGAVNHALIKSGLFLTGGWISERLGEQSMRRMGGLAGQTRSGTLAFGLGVVALAGLPPMNGFLSKFTLIQAGVISGEPVSLSAALVGSALGIAYSVRAFTLMFWGRAPGGLVRRWTQQQSQRGIPVAPLLLGLTYVALGVWPGPLLNLAATAAGELANPDIYIQAVLGAGR